jgi:hypothetical protein
VNDFQERSVARQRRAKEILQIEEQMQSKHNDRGGIKGGFFACMNPKLGHDEDSFKNLRAKTLFDSSLALESRSVLVQPEMKRGRFPLVSNPPFRARSL